MVKSEKKLKNLADLLGKKDQLLVLKAVELLREDEPFEGAVGLLADFYDDNRETPAGKAIESFMNDLKDQSLRSEVITEIKKQRKPATRAMLVSSCWQSGMDYSGFLSEFAEIFLASDYGTAIECFTVMEESTPLLDDAEKNDIIRILEEGKHSTDNQKKPLIAELIASIKR